MFNKGYAYAVSKVASLHFSSDDGHVENTEKGCFVTRGLLTPPFVEKSDQLKKLFDKSDGNYEVIVRQSKSKRLFFFDPEDLADRFAQ